MAHPLKKYARFVQRELGKDPEYQVPSYQWCLQQVQEHWHFAAGLRAQERKKVLLSYVKKDARRAHASTAEMRSSV